jgi:cytochrome c-type biogenesis protein CcmH/NrfG
MMQPLEPVAFVSSSPAVGALVSAADQNSQSGNLDSAVAAIERAIRIEPRNAALFYKLAELRLKQSKPRLAEDLAKKSALLASGNARLKRQSWLLIGNAKVMQQDFAGARAARAKAASF